MILRHPLRRGSSRAIALEYRDAAGEYSARQVMPVAIVTDDARQSLASTYLQARCSMAKAMRSFRLDRVQSISDPVTGEVLAAIDWLPTLQLGAGTPVTDIHGDAGDAEGLPNATGRTRHVLWRAVIAALVIGYLIGRFRLLRMGLHWLHQPGGYWL